MSRNPNARVYTDADKAEAIALMREHGPAQAARQLGIPSGTLRRWKSEAGETGPSKGQDPDDWAKQKEAVARASWLTARRALKAVNELIAAGKMADAQKGALAFAILVDKSQLLETNAAAARTRVLDGDEWGEPDSIDVPDDSDRLREVTDLLRQVGVLGEDLSSDDRGGEEPDLPLLLPPPITGPEAASEWGEFEPMVGRRRAVRVSAARSVPEDGVVVAPEASWSPMVETRREPIPVSQSTAKKLRRP
jgi:transposase-like protein